MSSGTHESHERRTSAIDASVTVPLGQHKLQVHVSSWPKYRDRPKFKQ